MLPEKILSLHRLVWTALCAALIAVGAFLQFPVGPVPFTMQPLFAFLAGYLLGPVRGPAAVLLYIAAGAAGLPIFAGGKAGVGVLFGPTGGYLIGFVLGAAVTGLSRRGVTTVMPWKRGLFFGALCLVAVYVPGLVQLKAVLGFTWAKAMTAGFLPFIIQDIAKIGLAVGLTRFLQARRLSPP